MDDHDAQKTAGERVHSTEQGSIELIENHMARYLGAADHVWHEKVSGIVHIAVHHIPPTSARNWHILYTTGMSELPMTVPEGAEQFRYAELMMYLPARWPMERLLAKEEAGEDVYWPVRWLKKLARYPHVCGTWLSSGHSTAGEGPLEPLGPGTQMTGFVLLPQIDTPEEFSPLMVAPDKPIHFWLLLPVHPEEMNLTTQQGVKALWDKLLDRFEDSEIIDPTRPCVSL